MYKSKDMEKHLVVIGMMFVFTICISHIASSASVSNDNNVNIRSEAAIDSSVLGKLSKDEEVKILDVEGNWIKISRNGLIGYVFNDYIDVEDNATINDTSVNFRGAATTGSTVLKRSEKGNRVSVLGEEYDFYKIIDDNKQYYVHNSLVDVDDNIVLEKQTLVNEELNEIGKNASIVGTDVNVRMLPNTASESVMKVHNGDEISVISKQDNWYKVQFGKDTYYIFADFVKLYEKEDKETKEIKEIKEEKNLEKQIIIDEDTPKSVKGVNSNIVYVKAITGLNLREEPNTFSKKITLLEYKSEQQVIEEIGDWIKVQTKDGHIGFAALEFLTYDKDDIDKIPNKELRDEVVAYAKQFYGTKYVWGGNSLTDGIDCSGFTQQVFGHFGIQLNRVSSDQVKNGSAITKPELLPGDLVFFATRGGNMISHVALYIGDNKIIHATSEQNAVGVDISDLSESYYINTYRCSARVIN